MVHFNKEDKEILISLIDREIDNFQSVLDRTNRDCWMDKIVALNSIKDKIKYKCFDAQVELESQMNEEISKYIKTEENDRKRN